MAEVVKMCDLTGDVAAVVFQHLNAGKVVLKKNIYSSDPILVTDVEPEKLVYPEGWYYGKGCFRNKHNSTTGFYHEIQMEKTNGQLWRNIAKYCTR